MRKILFVTFQDFANVSTDIAWAINNHLEGWEARVCSCIPHPFDYPRKHDIDFDFSTPEQKGDMERWIHDGIDVLIWAEEEKFPHYYYSFYSSEQTYSDAILFGVRDLLGSRTKKFIFHAGVAYRTYFAQYNEMDTVWFDGQILSPDLWRLSRGLEGISCFGKPMIDLDGAAMPDRWGPFFPGRIGPKELVVCHSPTDYGHKGTEIIDAAVARVQERLPHVSYRHIGGPVHNGKHIPHSEVIRQRGECHVYIDQFSEIGGIGMSALEAMGNGLITLCTTHMIPESIWTASGLRSSDCPLISMPAPTRDKEVDIQSVESALFDVCSRPDEMPSLAMSGIQWVMKSMDPKRFAERFILSLKEPLDCA